MFQRSDAIPNPRRYPVLGARNSASRERSKNPANNYNIVADDYLAQGLTISTIFMNLKKSWLIAITQF